MSDIVGRLRFAATAGEAYASLPNADGPVVITGNYGEAGAIERYRPSIPVFSGHNDYYGWGPPPPTARAAVFVGFPQERVEGAMRRSGRVRPDRRWRRSGR